MNNAIISAEWAMWLLIVVIFFIVITGDRVA